MWTHSAMQPKTLQSGICTHFISTSDVRTAHSTWTLGGYARVERSHLLGNTLSVPVWSGVAPGLYYVGAIVDYEGLITEDDEGINNKVLYVGKLNVQDCQ